ncbi:hypothetical protein BC938DRAFT_481872 [Jimgerdemannia flammicorona]|uniref:Uncharacterized protein n=1 Tax=Jimgerdemannia flammicorona TaxID=994334 RepID=A0A433QFV0_9FUNG|nr:hypothetical protein BC938DRAFT_481872 [Jimgerdemannia flammicorona]
MTDLRTSTKVFHFSDNSRVTGERQDVPNSASVTVQEVLDPSYGCYLWPSSLVLAEYVWHERLKFLNSTVLEVGC